jgi:hypothetical protein
MLTNLRLWILIGVVGVCAGLGSVAFADESYLVNFGQVRVMSGSDLYYDITNTGPETLILKDFEISGAEFSADTDCDAGPLAVKKHCTLHIQFFPQMEGLQTSELLLGFDHDKMVFDLQGIGIR